MTESILAVTGLVFADLFDKPTQLDSASGIDRYTPLCEIDKMAEYGQTHP